MSSSTIANDGAVQITVNMSQALKVDLESGLTKLVRGGYALSEKVMQANNLPLPGEALERYNKSGALMESLNRVFPPTPDAEKELLVLSSILPSVDIGILQTLSAELSRAVALRKTPDMGNMGKTLY